MIEDKKDKSLMAEGRWDVRQIQNNGGQISMSENGVSE